MDNIRYPHSAERSVEFNDTFERGFEKSLEKGFGNEYEVIGTPHHGNFVNEADSHLFDQLLNISSDEQALAQNPGQASLISNSNLNTRAVTSDQSLSLPMSLAGPAASLSSQPASKALVVTAVNHIAQALLPISSHQSFQVSIPSLGAFMVSADLSQTQLVRMSLSSEEEDTLRWLQDHESDLSLHLSEQLSQNVSVSVDSGRSA